MIRLVGHSMWPTLKEGDELVIDFQTREYSEGDILLTRTQNEWQSHRLIYFNKKQYLKGDRCVNFEELEPAQIWGKVIGFTKSNKEVIWGSDGPPAKTMLAWLSLNTRKTTDSKIRKAIRAACLLGMYLWRLTIEFFLAKKKIKY